MQKLILLTLVVFISACSSMKVSELDPNGRLPTKTVANIVKSQDIDLDQHKALLLVPDNEFVIGQLKKIGYFDELMTLEDLETKIIKEGLQDKVGSVTDRIGINKAYTHYKPFLWLRFDSRGKGHDTHGQFVLTNPGNLEDYFITETRFDYVWSGVNDQDNWYPMFNSLIEYIEKQSKTFNK